MTVARSGALVGIFCAAGASIGFSLNDMLVKFFSGDYPLHQIVLIRSIIGMSLTAGIFMQMEGGWRNLRTRRPFMHLARGLGLVAANLTFFTGLAALPLADATAIFFVAPLVIAALSVLFLGEQVGWRRWLAIAVGFIGVLVIVRPTSASFQVAAIMPVIAACCYAAVHIMTRKMGPTESASTMAIYVQLCFLVVSVLFGLAIGDGKFATDAHPSLAFVFAPWVWPAPDDFGLLLLVGASSATGGYLISQAYRSAEAGLVAPFEYLSLVFAIFWGFVVFSEAPSLAAAAGIALIIGSGLYLAFRESLRGARLSARRASERK